MLTDAAAVPGTISGVFMESMVGFVKNYFPVFLLGAICKVIELSGFSKSIVSAIIGIVGRERAMLGEGERFLILTVARLSHLNTILVA